MATTRSAIYLVVLALLAPWLYDRYVGLSTIVANRPGKLQHLNNFKSHEIKFADRIRNCEDVVLVEELGVAILSCDPGRDRWNTVMGTFAEPSTTKPDDNNGTIWIYDYTTPNLSDTAALQPLSISPPLSDFHPLGLAFDSPDSTLYVINHARSGTVIEIFTVDIPSRTAQHVQTFTHPLLHAPNSLELLGNRQMYITNDHFIRSRVSPLLSKIETFAAIPGGTVVYIDINKPDEIKVVARVPFANGIARLNSSTVAVASSSKSGVYFYRVAPNGVDLVFEKMVRTPAGADNLSVDENGKLLIAGHPFAPGLMEVSKGRPKCDEEGTEEERKMCGCWAPSWVGEWSEETGMRTLLSDGGEEVCSSSTAVRDVARGVGLVSLLYGKGILVFRD